MLAKDAKAFSRLSQRGSPVHTGAQKKDDLLGSRRCSSYSSAESWRSFVAEECGKVFKQFAALEARQRFGSVVEPAIPHLKTHLDGAE